MTSKQLYALRHPFEEVFVWLALNDQEVLSEGGEKQEGGNKDDEERKRREGGGGGNR
jgi:hypothetical protein